MKIAMVSSARSPQTVELVNHLADRGHQLALFSMPEHESIHNNIDRRVRVAYLPHRGMAGYFRNARPLQAMVEEFRPDVVNVHYAGGYGTLARRSRVRPLVMSVWGGDVSHCKYGYNLYKKLVRRNLYAADSVTCTDVALVDTLRNDLLYDGVAEVTTFGVDCRCYMPQNKSTGAGGQMRIGTVSTLEKRELEVLLRSIAQLERKLDHAVDIALFIYGNGNRQEAQELIDRMELNHKVKWKGSVKRSQLPTVLNRLDVVCALPTQRQETAAVLAMEAMACGVPVVYVGKNTLGSAVADGKTGFVLEKCDACLLAEKLHEMIRDRTLHRKFALEGRDRILQWYDLEQNVKQLELLYGRTVNQFRMESGQ